MTPKHKRPPPRTIGWREWVGFPCLEGVEIKAKIDTGARSSAIHAFNIETFERAETPWASFELHPVQRHRVPTVRVEAPLVDQRAVRSSNGVSEERLVITTPVQLGPDRFPIELTLTNRDEMGFRLLLGRSALRRRYLVDSSKSYLLGRPAWTQ